MADHSFFHLSPQSPPPSQREDWNPWDDLTPQEYEAAFAGAQPLFEVLLATIDAYAQEHNLTMLQAWMAADIVRYCIGCDIQEADADA